MKNYARFVAALSCSILLFSLSACAPREKEVVPPDNNLYPWLTLAELSEQATVILRGTIVNQGQTIVEQWEYDGGTLTEVYTEMILDVEEVLKEGEEEIGEEYIFRAWGGETSDKIYLGILEFEIGDEVLLFLNEYNVPFGPDSIYFIQDGETTAEYYDFGDDLPQTYAAEGAKPSDVFTLPVQDVIDYIKTKL